LCTYFLYTVSHPDQYGAPTIDLSLDEEAKDVSMSSFTASEAQMKLEQVIGPEKVRLFKHIDIPDLFASLPSGHKIQCIWVLFWSLHN